MTHQIWEQTWWNQENLKNGNTYETFIGWLGDETAPSRVWFRNYLMSNPGYNSIIDIGCGPAVDYTAYPTHGINLAYTGIDSSSFLVEQNKSRGVNMIQAPGHSIPVNDSSYDIAYSRHVLEHQPDFKANLQELIRVGSKLAVHVFFKKPTDNKIINYDGNINLWCNTYLTKDIEDFLLSNSKVESFNWFDITADENILIIKLK